MSRQMEIDEIRAAGRKMIAAVGLSNSPVGVRLLRKAEPWPERATRLRRHRYCQALMLARRGDDVVLDGQGISCPAAAAAFGFRKRPVGLQSGKTLVGFGIVSDEAVGKRMFADMPTLPPGQIEALHLFPLEASLYVPDIVVVEDLVERLMWIVLSYLHATGGQRVMSTTAVLQNACVDSTIVPYLENRLNFGYGCYGCREATDIAPGEALLGFPAAALSPVIEHLVFLADKAIPTSRSKQTLHKLEHKADEEGSSPLYKGMSK
ncbi:DUF169 domain-containing protein [Desulfoferrobacter suflitae]|uniref:DUF169 domain-containing protein n=1 Tax=Desulfoferrobacter suflitae TaxID=2865782 RepID=UPI002164A740|nr:DUF169 domain-containing protein [Desulfoferrobacter suflitae]MCK8603743.1 DUF169 domain-containing protein [Desulfoferrobacter suflitae]